MRVIAGLYRGRSLASAPGLGVRPTSDRLRETLFNILSPVIEGARFLDLCAGTGAVGIEALSRGAGHVTFVEESGIAYAFIIRNLAAVRVEEAATIIKRDVRSALRSLDLSGEKFDIIFFDPPYSSDLYSPVMNFISKSGLIAQNGVVIVEHRTNTEPENDYHGLSAFRRKKQGNSKLSFYSREETLSSE
ncbi:MAG: 16S rRNA (guanine(966)-N(2))-methyltransferase RsmD [Blastocatellia bacterium AA13]|nr:MAG: 16S rRNA (guanine(966)-N(2))-methyltransferase RsmD [Blastocatellia bacterium AA13]